MSINNNVTINSRIEINNLKHAVYVQEQKIKELNKKIEELENYNDVLMFENEWI